MHYYHVATITTLGEVSRGRGRGFKRGDDLAEWSIGGVWMRLWERYFDDITADGHCNKSLVFTLCIVAMKDGGAYQGYFSIPIVPQLDLRI